MNLIRVGVLLGGSSNEKEISLESGRNIVYKLSPHKYAVTPLFVTSTNQLYTLTPAQLVYNSTKEVELALTQTSKINWSSLPELFDFIFIGLHGGLGENGSVQGALEMLGVPYNGSGVLTSALCMDKYKTSQFLRSNGFDTPASLLISKAAWTHDQDSVLSTVLATLTLPIIIKPHDDGCSVMVHKATTQHEVVHAVNDIFNNGKDSAMAEEFITGMELTVGVLGNTDAQAMPPSQTVATKAILSIEEKFLPGAGENQTPAPLPEEALTFVRRTMENIYTVLGCKGYARIDCFYQSPQQSPTGKERVITLEVNTLPGMTPATCLFHQAAEIGLRPMELIDMIVQFGLKEHAKPAITQPQMHKEQSRKK